MQWCEEQHAPQAVDRHMVQGRAGLEVVHPAPELYAGHIVIAHAKKYQHTAKRKRGNRRRYG